MNDIIEEINKRGYDSFINNDEVVVLKDGFVTQTPILNIINLITPKEIEFDGKKTLLPGISTSDIVALILENHKIKKKLQKLLKLK
jgi:hypothetical protein